MGTAASCASAASALLRAMRRLNVGTATCALLAGLEGCSSDCNTLPDASLCGLSACKRALRCRVCCPYCLRASSPWYKLNSARPAAVPLRTHGHGCAVTIGSSVQIVPGASLCIKCYANAHAKVVQHCASNTHTALSKQHVPWSLHDAHRSRTFQHNVPPTPSVGGTASGMSMTVSVEDSTTGMLRQQSSRQATSWLQCQLCAVCPKPMCCNKVCSCRCAAPGYGCAIGHCHNFSIQT